MGKGDLIYSLIVCFLSFPPSRRINKWIAFNKWHSLMNTEPCRIHQNKSIKKRVDMMINPHNFTHLLATGFFANCIYFGCDRDVYTLGSVMIPIQLDNARIATWAYFHARRKQRNNKFFSANANLAIVCCSVCLYRFSNLLLFPNTIMSCENKFIHDGCYHTPLGNGVTMIAWLFVFMWVFIFESWVCEMCEFCLAQGLGNEIDESRCSCSHNQRLLLVNWPLITRETSPDANKEWVRESVRATPVWLVARTCMHFQT